MFVEISQKCAPRDAIRGSQKDGSASQEWFIVIFDLQGDVREYSGEQAGLATDPSYEGFSSGGFDQTVERQFGLSQLSTTQGYSVNSNV
jgi:hypothetical protein